MLRMVPNILSAFRIFLVPVFVAVYFTDNHSVKIWAVGIYALAGFTDFLDGFIARKYNLTSEMGKVLDPLGDKLMLVAALTCITIDNVIPAAAVVTVIVKEALMGLGGLLIHQKKADIPPSNILGKISTVLFIVTCLTLMLFPSMPDNAAAAIVLAAVAMMLIALGSYIPLFISTIKNGAVKNGSAKKDL